MKISDLKPSDYNPRKITDKALKSLAKAMKKFGDLSGVVVNVRTGNMVGGHQRIKCLDPSWKIKKEEHTDDVGTVALGHIITPFGRWQYREVDWPKKKEGAANVAANKHGGEWDIPRLKDILVELDDGDFDLELTGFDEDELKELIDWDGEEEELNDAEPQIDRAEELREEWGVSEGDLWALGDHRLLDRKSVV